MHCTMAGQVTGTHVQMHHEFLLPPTTSHHKFLISSQSHAACLENHFCLHTHCHSCSGMHKHSSESIALRYCANVTLKP